MRTTKAILAVSLTLLLVSGGAGAREFDVRDDPGSTLQETCALQYFYYIPYEENVVGQWWDPQEPGDMIGVWFQIGDMSMGEFEPCDPLDCMTIEAFRVACTSSGIIYCGRWNHFECDIYCADEDGCPVGPSLWSCGPEFPAPGLWNYFTLDVPLCVTDCCVDPGPPPSGPCVLITATNIDPVCNYPCWALDSAGEAVLLGCEMHDIGCLEALYPRPQNSHYSTMHSGYYGRGGFDHCPPLWFCDEEDTTPDCSQYGYSELMWTLYLGCHGPSSTEPVTWGALKSLYR